MMNVHIYFNNRERKLENKIIIGISIKTKERNTIKNITINKLKTIRNKFKTCRYVIGSLQIFKKMPSSYC